MAATPDQLAVSTPSKGPDIRRKILKAMKFKHYFKKLLILVLTLSTAQLFGQNVGIGTDTPQDKLEVADAGSTNIRITSTDNNAAGLSLHSLGINSDWRMFNGGGSLLFSRGDMNGFMTSRVRFGDDNRYGFGDTTPDTDFEISLGSTDTELRVTASNFVGRPKLDLMAGIEGFASYHWRVGQDNRDLVFQYGRNDFAFDSIEAMRILNDGKIGIGTSNPVTDLHILGEMKFSTSGFSTSQKDKVAIHGTLEDPNMLGLGWLKTAGGIGTFTDDPINRSSSMVDIYEMYYKSQGAHRWFIDQNATAAAVPKMILDEDGNLGIGPDEPDTKLHVTGGFFSSLTSPGIAQFGATSSIHMAFDNNEIQARNNGASANLYLQYRGGNLSLASETSSRVGIGTGTSTPQAKLQITDGTDVNVNGGGELVLGLTNNLNLAMDGNEIQARDNGTASQLIIQQGGGDVMMIPGENGQVGIGISSIANLPDSEYLLAVDGKIISEEVRVELSGSWPDYVFKDDYQLTPLNQLESEIESLGHLPGIPSAQQVENDGFELGDMQKRMMEKIEELTLYMIEANKEIARLKTEVNNLKKQ